LTGRVPFDGSSVQSLLAAHITKPPPAIASIRPDIPASLSSAIDRLLEKDPARRFQTGEELAEHLDPLRSSRREISPAIRLFSVKSNQIIRNSVMLLLLAPTLMNSVRGDADQLVILMIVLAAVAALSFQVVSGLRELASQGYTHEDLKAGLTAIGNEQHEARALIRAGSDWQERQRRRRWFMIGGLVTAVILIFISFRLRVPRPQGGYTTGWAGLITAALGASLLVSTWIYAIASGHGSARIDGWLRSLWTGNFGRGLYNIIANRIRTRPAVRAVSTEIGAMTVFEGLSKAMRRDLGDVNRVITSLIGAQNELLERESRLESSQDEASRGTAGVATDTLERVVTELSQAKSAVAKQREEITAELERLRLELIRLRSGVGTVAEVRAESERGKALMTGGLTSATL
jgi:Serine/threonine protein kinase